MARIAFILLCHKDPKSVIRQARQLTAAGDYIAIHFDSSASEAQYREIQLALADNPSVTFPKRRVRCGWGEWSLVQATLNAVRAACDAFPRATHFYLISGDCMSIKPARYAHDYLDSGGYDFIENFDFFESDWIKTGFKDERLIYRHFFNERGQKSLFYAAYNLQKNLGLTRKLPKDIPIMIGSQWWCLRRRTIEAILEFIDNRKDIVRFFKTSWIPDEIFFQSLVNHLVPGAEIQNRTLTFLMFTDYGMPVTFYNDHYDLLLGQDYLFARKISPEANKLKQRLGDLYANDDLDVKISGEGRSLHAFLTKRGRVGQRFAPRFWENSGTMGRDRELLIVACKKWHVAKRLVEQIQKSTNLIALEYVFDEKTSAVPEFGGIENSMMKRSRHRRALMRMLFDYHGTDQMLICLDPANLDLAKDFYNDRSQTRLLEIECRFNDEYLEGHARRIGLVGSETPPDAITRLLPSVRNELMGEVDRLRDAAFPDHFRLKEAATVDENAIPLAQFLQISQEKARDIVSLDHLFAD